MAPRATSTFTHHGGRARVACEKAVPAATSTMAPSAVVQAIPPSDAQAAIATADGGQAGHPQPYRVLGRPRLVGSPDDLNDVHDRAPPLGTAPATARARRRPALRRSETGPTTGPCILPGPEQHRGAALQQLHDRTERAFCHAFGRVGVSGQLHRDRHGLGCRLLDLSHHEATGMGGRAPVHKAAGVPGDVGTGAPRQPRLHARAARLRRPPRRRGAERRDGPRHNAAPRAAERGAPAGPASSTTAVRMAPPKRCRA